jgi:transcriptional regulator with XRE-family HTH domain
MIDRRKKYKITTSNGHPHCGELLRNYLIDNKTSQAFVATQLGVRPSTVNSYFNNASLQIGILWKISQILNYNFIAALAEKIPIPFETQATIGLKKQLYENETNIQKLEMKIEVYKEMKTL